MRYVTNNVVTLVIFPDVKMHLYNIISHLNTYSDQIIQQPHDLLQHRPMEMEDISLSLFPDVAGTWKQLSYRPL